VIEADGAVDAVVGIGRIPGVILSIKLMVDYIACIGKIDSPF
jgi:hypothetical protein